MDELARILLTYGPVTGIILGLVILFIVVAYNAPKTLEQWRMWRKEESEERERRAKEHTEDRLALMKAAETLAAFTKEALELLNHSVSEFANLATQKNALDTDYRRVVSQIQGLQDQVKERDKTIAQLQGEIEVLRQRVVILEAPKKSVKAASKKPAKKEKAA